MSCFLAEAAADCSSHQETTKAITDDCWNSSSVLDCSPVSCYSLCG